MAKSCPDQTLVDSRDVQKKLALHFMQSITDGHPHQVKTLVMAWLSAFKSACCMNASHLVIKSGLNTSSSPDNAHLQMCIISSSLSVSGAEKRIPELPMPPKSAINEESPDHAQADIYICTCIHMNYAQRVVSVVPY